MIGNDPNSGSLNAIIDSVTSYVKLLIEDTRLNVTEKLIRLLSAITLCALSTVLVTAFVFFVSVAVGEALAEVMNPLWAFLIVAAFYLLILIVLVVWRTQLIITPISRFISRLLLPAPKKEKSNDQSATIS